MAYSSSNPFAPKPEDETSPESTAKPSEAAEGTETPAEPSWPARDEDGNPYSAWPPVLAKDLPIGGGPMPTSWGGRTTAPVRFDLLALHEADPGVVAAAMRIPGRDPEALEFWGDISGYRTTGAERFTGLGRDHLGDISFPPTMPEWQAFLADHEVSADKAAAVLRTGGKDPRLMRAWAEATAKAIRSRLMCSAILAQARKYTDPDTGYGWDHLVAAKSGASLVDRAVAADKAWKDQRAASSFSAVPSLDLSAVDTEPEPLIGKAMAAGETALLVTRTDAVARDLVMARLTGGEFLGDEVAQGPVTLVDGVSSARELSSEWAEAVDAYPLHILPYRATGAAAPVHELVYAQEVAEAIPRGSLIVVNDLDLIQTVGISEATAEARGWLAGWERVADLSEAVGLVVVHGPTKNDPRTPRGHSAISQWPDHKWIHTGAAKSEAAGSSPGETRVAKQDFESRVLAAVTKDPNKPISHYVRTLRCGVTPFYRAMENLMADGKLDQAKSGNAKVLFPRV